MRPNQPGLNDGCQLDPVLLALLIESWRLEQWHSVMAGTNLQLHVKSDIFGE